jgi:aryl-alcohol dehydrogenase-like predicted oxidoreductase
MLGEFIADSGLRDDLVLATKFTWNMGGTDGQPRRGNPNGGGNGRKHIHAALEASLKRLRTDHVDLYWLHFWDMVTPVEEVLDTLVDLIRAGKIRYYALSDVPAWYMTRMATLAEARGVPGPVALQTPYSLVERSADYEHILAARELGIGVQPWSPLSGGFLTGKYRREEGKPVGEGRLSGDNPLGQSPFTDRNWGILDVLRGVADEIGRSRADVALAWATMQRGVDSVLIGASRPDQLTRNIAALDIHLTPEQLATLNDASRPPAAFPWSGFVEPIRRSIFGGADVRHRPG